VGHELVAKYSRARDETWLSEVVITEKDRYQVAMVGDPNTALELAIFENDGDEISMNWAPVPDFKGEVKFTI
jgi:hypothetical protein